MKITKMSKISIIRVQKDGTRTFRRWEMSELVEELRGNRFNDVINRYREYYPLVLRERKERREYFSKQQLEDVPRICFATEYARFNSVENIQGYSPLLMMSVSNLRNENVAEGMRKRAAMLPYTRLAFVGVSGRAVVIVCELHPLCKKVETADGYSDLLLRGYALLRKIYSDHLQAALDVAEPSLDVSCYFSHDPYLYYNNLSAPFPVDMLSKSPASYLDYSYALPAQVEDTEDRYRWRRIYLDNLHKAQSMAFSSDDPEFEALLKLAHYCHETGMPQALAESFAIINGDFCRNEIMVRDVFATEYEKELRSVNPNKHLNATAQMIMRTSNFLNVHYRFRRNVLNGVVEYRLNDGTDFEYHTLTKTVQNSMTIKALEAGLNSWDKDLERFINSDRITEYDPINEYLETLPQWDGKDRIAALAHRVPTDTRDWERNFHVWLRSVVAQWMGRDEQHGNAIAPILIGAQATGKSSFCRILLPSPLQEYYNDSIHFKDDKSVFLALSSFALINIDEFDSLSRTQQPLLKYLLSKSDVKYRAAYHNYIEQHKRYASFIATTNKQQPLNDPTGSRRFICVKVLDAIDFTTPIDYEQVYAQLRDEIMHGERYWFTKDEADVITMQNAPYQKNFDLSAFVTACFRAPRQDENVTPLSIAEITQTLTMRFPALTFTANSSVAVGKMLKSLGYEQVRSSNGRKYLIVKV